MHVTPEWTEQIVQRVLARLHESHALRGIGPGDAASVDKPSVPATSNETDFSPAGPSVVRCGERVVGCELLPGLFPELSLERAVFLKNRVRRPRHVLQIAEKAVVTPAAREWMADRGIAIEKTTQVQLGPSPRQMQAGGAAGEKQKQVASRNPQPPRLMPGVFPGPGNRSAKVTLLVEGFLSEKFHPLQAIFDALLAVEPGKLLVEAAARTRRGEFVVTATSQPERLAAELNRFPGLFAAVVSAATCLTRLELQPARVGSWTQSSEHHRTAWNSAVVQAERLVGDGQWLQGLARHVRERNCQHQPRGG